MTQPVQHLNMSCGLDVVLSVTIHDETNSDILMYRASPSTMTVAGQLQQSKMRVLVQGLNLLDS